MDSFPPVPVPLPLLIAGHVLLAGLVAWFAHVRGRAVPGWFLIALVCSPPVAAVLLWFLPDLEHERHQTREFLNRIKQRRNRRDPHDTFSRTRDRQEQEIQAKAITTRRERQRRVEATPASAHRLRSRENRTPATVIMQM